jgi:hypothetical protein
MRPQAHHSTDLGLPPSDSSCVRPHVLTSLRACGTPKRVLASCAVFVARSRFVSRVFDCRRVARATCCAHAGIPTACCDGVRVRVPPDERSDEASPPRLGPNTSRTSVSAPWRGSCKPRKGSRLPFRPESPTSSRLRFTTLSRTWRHQPDGVIFGA